MAKDHLLQIISSLSAKEKRTFNSLMKAQHKGKTPYFLLLYNQFNKVLVKNINEEETAIELEKFLNKNNKIDKDLSNIKNQLKDKLLLSLLNEFHIEDKKSQVYNYLVIIRKMIDRELINVAGKLLNTYKTKAEKLDLNDCLTKLTDLELEILGKQSEKKDIVNQNKLIKELEKHQTLYALETQLKNIFRQMTLIAQIDAPLNHTHNVQMFKAAYTQLQNKQINIDDYKKEKNINIIYWFYRIQNLYYRSINEFDNAFNSSQALLQYFESDVDIIENFEPYYIKSLCGFVKTCYHYKKEEALEQSLEKIKYLYESKTSYPALITSCDTGVLHYLNTQQYDKAIELTNIMEKEWEAIVSKSFDGQLLWYARNNMLLYWLLDNQQKFKFWLDEGLNIPRSNKGRDYYFGIRMFELMYDFEQGNLYFDQKVESLKKTLQNNANLSTFEQTMLSYFNTLYKIEQKNKFNIAEKSIKLKESFQSLKIKLLAFEFKNSPINYEEVILWCESHLQNQPLKAVFETQA